MDRHTHTHTHTEDSDGDTRYLLYLADTIHTTLEQRLSSNFEELAEDSSLKMEHITQVNKWMLLEK
jgi:hypothetical protein